jgi:NAD(P)-dependent dehydrogenase (short-subunit alcohol dehydrogenase family)
MSRAPCCIAGAGPGLGAALAQRFAAGGHPVALLGRRAEALAPIAAAVRAAGAPAATVAVDLADPAAVQRALAEARAALGPPALLVWNPARWLAVPALELAADEFATELALGATAPLAALQAAWPDLKAAGGTALFTGGGLALRPELGAGVSGLAAAKSALRGLVHALAAELASEGVHIATITIAGTIAAGTAFDPARIAERFWAIAQEPPGAWTVESIFTG